MRFLNFLNKRSTYDVGLDIALIAALVGLYFWFGTPADKFHTGWFLIGGGAFCALAQFLVRPGRPKSRFNWSSEEQKTRMVIGGIGSIALGFLILVL